MLHERQSVIDVSRQLHMLVASRQKQIDKTVCLMKKKRGRPPGVPNRPKETRPNQPRIYDRTGPSHYQKRTGFPQKYEVIYMIQSYGKVVIHALDREVAEDLFGQMDSNELFKLITYHDPKVIRATVQAEWTRDETQEVKS